MISEELAIYFKGIDWEEENSTSETIDGTIERFLEGSSFPEIEKESIVIFNVPEYRNSRINEGNQSKNGWRGMLYELSKPEHWTRNIYDLGAILPGSTIEDTYYALENVVSVLVKNNCIPVIIGGSQDLTYAIYKGYQKLEQTVNITNIDYTVDVGNPEEAINDTNYISHILTTRPCMLFDYSIIGTQVPFIKPSELKLIDSLYFDFCRLGDLVADFKRAEPLIRNSDILTLDMLSLKNRGDFPAVFSNPNGINPEMACQIAKYTGVSDRLTSFFIGNYYNSTNSVTLDSLLAQIIWYFMDGVAARYGDFPITSLKDYLKFTVKMVDVDEEIIFYKSEKSNRWWMEVPYPAKPGVNFKRHTIVPCNHEDYLQAMKNDIPNLWWKTFQKLF